MLTGLDYSKKDDLYDQTKKSLLKFKGEQGVGCAGDSSSPAIKLEPAYLAEHEEALVAAGYMKIPNRSYQPWGYSRRGSWRGSGS